MIPQNCVLYSEQCDKKKKKDEEHLLPKLLSVVTVVIVLSGFLVCVCVCVCACTYVCVYLLLPTLQFRSVGEEQRIYVSN